MTGLRTSLAFSLATRYGTVAIQAAALVVLARLLTPEEVGVYAIAAALLALVSVLGDFAVEVYLVQAPRLRRSERQAAVAVTLVTSAVVGTTFLASRGAVAEFYAEPRLEPMMLAMGATLFLVPLNLPILAMLRRRMMFGTLLLLTTAGNLAFAIAAIALAVAGHGAMSMAWATVAQTIAVTVLAVWHRPAPLCWPHLRAWRRVVVFGLTATSTVAIFRLGFTAPELIIGRMLGLEATGLFSRANGIAQIFGKVVVNAIQPVALPALAAELRAGRSLKPALLQTSDYIAAFAWPSYIFVALMADPMVQIVLGPQWAATVPIIQILCLMGVPIPFLTLNAEFFVALGKPQRQLVIESATFPIRIGLIAAASLHSVEAVALAIVAAKWVSAALSNHYLARELGYSLREMVRAVRKPLVILAGSTLGPAAIALGLDNVPHQPLPVLGIAAFAAAAGWLATVFATHHPLESEVRLLGQRLIGFAKVRWSKAPGA
jgi:O-antigen/teichoic acid export membrane protein